MLPDGYENSPPNIRRAFEDGRNFGRQENMGEVYARGKEQREAAAGLVWNAVMKGMDMRTMTVSAGYLQYIRPSLPLRRQWETTQEGEANE